MYPILTNEELAVRLARENRELLSRIASVRTNVQTLEAHVFSLTQSDAVPPADAPSTPPIDIPGPADGHLIERLTRENERMLCQIDRYQRDMARIEDMLIELADDLSVIPGGQQEDFSASPIEDAP